MGIAEHHLPVTMTLALRMVDSENRAMVLGQKEDQTIIMEVVMVQQASSTTVAMVGKEAVALSVIVTIKSNGVKDTVRVTEADMEETMSRDTVMDMDGGNVEPELHWSPAG